MAFQPSDQTVHASLMARAAAEDKWKALLDESMQSLRSNYVVAAALKTAVYQEFDPERGNLRQLTTVQVRGLRTELVRNEKIWQAAQAAALVSGIVEEIDNSSSEEGKTWTSKLETGLKELCLGDDLLSVLKSVAPNSVPEADAGVVAKPEATTLAVDTTPEENSAPTPAPAVADASPWSKVTLADMTVEQVRALHEALLKIKVARETQQPKPRALMRALQALYHAESIEEAESSLLPETADEEALRQLIERSEEFAPALKAMRSVAVDHEVFKHLADQSGDEGGEDVKTESEASDVEKDLIGKKEIAPVVLPPGWRLEWVKKKKREVREFVDPAGNRYTTIREVRAGLEEWEAHGGNPKEALETQGKANGEGGYSALSASDAFGDAEGGKRRRLYGKNAAATTSSVAVQEDFFEGLADEAFGDMLDATLEPWAEAPAPAAVESAAMDKPVLRPGVRVRLHGLVAKPELNGKPARIHAFVEETGRWEVFLEPGAACDRANLKPANLDALPASEQDFFKPQLNRRLTGKTNAAALVPKRQRQADKKAPPGRPALRRKGASDAAVASQAAKADDESD